MEDSMLDFRIETFITVCRFMNFTKAAQYLNITQPAVSQQIRYLEEYFGSPLFDYQKRKLSLTEAGQAVLSASITFTNDQNRLRKHIQSLTNEKKHLIFGATLTIGEYVLPPYLASYRKQHLSSSFTLFIQDTSRLLQKLDQGEIDFAFIEGYFPKHDYDYIPWTKERLVPVCSPSHPILQQSEISLKDILSVPFILREKGSGTRDTLEHFLACENVSVEDFQSVIEVGGIEAIKSLAASGAGITFLYEPAFRKELSENRLVPIPMDCDFSNEFSFIWRKNSLYSQEYSSFFHDLISQHKNIPEVL